MPPSARASGARRAGLVLVAGALIGLGAVALASRLQLRTSFAELLPSRDPAVRALKRAEGRVGDLNLLTVGIRSPDRAANLAYAKLLTEGLSAMPPSRVGLVAYHLRDLQAFVRDHRWLYASAADLEQIRDRLRGEILRRKNPLVVPLDDDGDGRAAEDAALRARLDRSPLAQRFPDGYFVRGDVAWVLVLPAGGLFDEHAGEALVRAVDAFVAAHPPAAFHPAMRVQSLGPVVVGLENRRAIEEDIVGVTLFCTALIALSIALYFRGLRAVGLVVLPALWGTAIAFGCGQLIFGYLNASTAFLGSIILGNGINHAIMLLSRYRELDGPGAIARAVRTSGRATLTAACAAAACYLALTLTSFRGFSQFGVMAAIGSIACWAGAYTLIPAWLALRGRSRGGGARAPWSLGPLAAAIARRPRALILASLALTVAAILGLRHFVEAPFEYDFRRLRADIARNPERVRLDDNLNDLLGRWHSPTVVLADRLEQVEQIPAVIRARDAGPRPVIGNIVTIYNVLPGTPAVQRQKLALLADIRALALDPALQLLPDDQRAEIQRLTPPVDLRALGPQDLPPLARRPFTENDGTVGRLVLVYHADKRVSMWDGHDLLAIASVLQRLPLPDGTVIETSGTPMLFGAMLRAVLRDGPRATVISFLLAAALIALLVRPGRAAAIAIATLLLGVLWMVGAAGLLQVRVTFLNFVALPITFGVGGEYAINVIARWRRDRSAVAAVRSVGGAVLLCSWTTIVGYGSLLAAHSQALRGFGALAVLGEISCLLAAVVAVPAWLAFREARGRDPGRARQA
ncbi:MAG TPA: MMPL family transporter [Polyangia bacterium]|nr:MMPL family transporter [Polyangia bacterium]